MLIFKSTDTLSGAIPLEIWACLVLHTIFEFYRAKTIYMIVDCQVESLKIVRHVMRNWYHFAMMFSDQTLYLVRPLSFKHVSNKKPLFD